MEKAPVLEKLSRLEQVASRFDFLEPQRKRAQELIEKVNAGKLNIVFVGEFSSGKTSLINALFGLSLPTDVLPQTAHIWKIKAGEGREIKAHLLNGEVKEVSPEEASSLPQEEVSYFELEVPVELDRDITIVDTPGLSSLSESHTRRLQEFMDEADLVFVVVDVNQGVTASVIDFLRNNSLSKERTFVVLSKADTKSEGDLKEIKKYILDELGETFSSIVTTSAKNGSLEEIRNLINYVSDRKSGFATVSVSDKVEDLCEEIRHLIVKQIDNANLDLSELLDKEKTVLETLYKAEADILSKDTEFRALVRTVMVEIEDVLENYVTSRLDYIVDALYDENLEEEIEDRFLQVLQEGVEKANGVLKDRIGEFESLMQSLKGELEKGYSELHRDFLINKVLEKIVKGREIIVRAIGRLAREFVRQRFKRDWKGIEDILRRLADLLIVHATRAYIKDRVSDLMEETVDGILKRYKEYLVAAGQELIGETVEELKRVKESYEKAYLEIREEKKKREEEFEKYLADLERALSELPC